MEVTTVFLFSFMLSATTSTKGKKKLKYSTELFKRLTTSFHETKVTASRENANCNSSHHVQERRAMLEASALQGEHQTKGWPMPEEQIVKQYTRSTAPASHYGTQGRKE